MRRVGLGDFAIAALIAVGSGLPAHAESQTPRYDWTGPYAGVSVGAARGSYKLGVNDKFDWRAPTAAQN